MRKLETLYTFLNFLKYSSEKLRKLNFFHYFLLLLSLSINFHISIFKKIRPHYFLFHFFGANIIFAILFWNLKVATLQQILKFKTPLVITKSIFCGGIFSLFMGHVGLCFYLLLLKKRIDQVKIQKTKRIIIRNYFISVEFSH